MLANATLLRLSRAQNAPPHSQRVVRHPTSDPRARLGDDAVA
jgi:hypothetical protein